MPQRASAAGSTRRARHLLAGLPNTSRNHEDGILMSLTHSFTQSFTIQSDGTKPPPAHIIHNPSGKGQKDNQLQKVQSLAKGTKCLGSNGKDEELKKITKT